MKLNKYSWLAALPMIFTACQEDTLVKEQQQDKIYTLSATMDGGAAMSRAQIQLGNNDASAEIFMWNKDDSFDMYQNVDDAWNRSIFTISSDFSESGENTSSATFTAYNPATIGDYVAIYPSGLTLDDGIIQCSIENESTLDFTSDTEAEVWKDYFNRNMYMMTEKDSLIGADDNVLTFKHLTSLIRITYTNQTSVTQKVCGVALGGNQHFRLWNKYSMANASLVENGGITNDYVTYMQGLSVEPGHSTDLYIFSFPCDFNDGEMHINIIDENGSYKCAKMPTKILMDNLGSKGFEASMRYWFQITETESDGLIWSKDFGKVIIPNVELSNALYDYLDEGTVSINYNGYAVMEKSDALNVHELSFDKLDDYGKNVYTITSLNGIENFINLTKLTCMNTGLDGEVDLRSNSNLTYLDVSFNGGLTSLNIDGLVNLTALKYSETGITSLAIPAKAIPFIKILCYGRQPNVDNPVAVYVPNVNDFVSLEELACYGQEFTLTNAAIKAKLMDLQCYMCNLSELDLTEYPNLVGLTCYANNLEELIIPQDSKIGHLNCFGNKLKALDITPLEDTLYDLYCGYQNIGEGNKMLLTLTDSQMQKWENSENGWYVKGLNEYVDQREVSGDGTIVIGNASLTAVLKEKLGESKVQVNENGHAVIALDDADGITELKIDPKFNVTTLNKIESFTNLEVLICNDNNLTDVTLTNSKLHTVELSDNHLTKLNVSGLSNLTKLSCAGNGELKDNLNIEGTSLKEIRFQHTNATQLPVGLNPELLEILDCGDNNLTSFDLSEYNKLKYVYFARNELTSDELTMPENNKIEELDFSGNKGITTLDLTIYPSLKTLWLSSCKIQALNFSKCTDINFISCEKNKLSALDLTNNINVTYLTCGEQRDEANCIKNLALTLPEDLLNRWNNDWKRNSSNYYVGVNGNEPEFCKMVSNFYELQDALAKNVKLMQIFLTDNIELESPLTPASNAIIWLKDHTLSISDNYQAGGEKAVFNLMNGVNLNIAGGQLQGRDGSKLHDYYFNVAERFTEVILNDVTLNTGSAIPNAFYMYHSSIQLENATNITAPSRVIDFYSPVEIEGFAHSKISIDGTLNGNFYLDNLNCRFEVLSGVLNGNFEYSSSLNPGEIKDHFLLADEVVKDEKYTGWDVVGELIKASE